MSKNQHEATDITLEQYTWLMQRLAIEQKKPGYGELDAPVRRTVSLAPMGLSLS